MKTILYFYEYGVYQIMQDVEIELTKARIDFRINTRDYAIYSNDRKSWVIRFINSRRKDYGSMSIAAGIDVRCIHADKLSSYDDLIDYVKDVEQKHCEELYNRLYGKEASVTSVDETDFGIKKVIFNDPATIVFWKDGTKTVVKCAEGDTFNKEIGLVMAIVKKQYGNDNTFHKIFKKYIPLRNAKNKED